MPTILLSKECSTSIDNFQVRIKDEVLSTWNKIINPAYFAIYKRESNKFVLLNTSFLPKRFHQLELPEFDLGIGLTGSVYIRPNSEIYEPFIEDYGDPDCNEHRSCPTPYDCCRNFWDDVIGDKKRMFYGRHVKVGLEDYILVIIGARRQKFMPSLGYKLVRNALEAIIPQFITIIVDTCHVSNDQASQTFNLPIELQVIENQINNLYGVNKQDKEKIIDSLYKFTEKKYAALKQESSLPKKKFHQTIKDILNEVSSNAKNISTVEKFILT